MSNLFNRSATQKKWIVAGTVRAALLARVSTNKQLDNTSSEDQLERCRAYCESKGYAVVVEKVESLSGALVLAREDFQEFCEMGRRGEIDVIVVDKPDRLGRGEAIATLQYMAKQAGLRIEYVRAGRDTSTIEGMALNFVDQLSSGIERHNFRQRSIDGKNATARKGMIVRTRFRPFGYKYEIHVNEKGKIDNCWLVIVEDEAEIVKQMYEWVSGEGLTLYGVTKRLNEMKVVPPSHRDGAGVLCPKKQNQRGCWVRATVGKILRSRTYMGEWCWGKNEYHTQDSVDGVRQLKGRKREIEEMPIVQVPEIVSKKLWDRVQVQLEENRRKFVRPTSIPFLLRSRIKCAKCGGKMGSYTVRRRNSETFYRCWKNAGSETPGTARGCNAKMVPTDILDGPVWDYITEIVQDERKLFAGLAESRRKVEKAHRVIQQSIAIIESKNERTAYDLEKLIDMHLSGDITREAYRKKKEEIEASVAKRLLEKADFEERLRAHSFVSEDDENALRAIRDSLRRRIRADIPTQDKMQILDILKVQCIWDEVSGEITVSGFFQSKVVHTKGSCGYQQFQVPFATTLFVRGFSRAGVTCA